MSLSPGTRVGPYEVIGALGAGGMGEVYRARDARLNRDVAIKILPELFASDPERLARFEREARALAALNHPNIAAIYGIEDRALVMELVEGEDLSTIIAKGAMPFSDALPIARQIADALEAAHEQGIVHRDLKPANIKVRGDGTVKVLDFGLAKAIDPAGTSTTSNASNSPTLTARATQMGMIIGTAAYMAPEQAKGRSADRRADIWAFGVVLYEMLTGQRTFAGDDISEVLASVLKTDPEWHAIPAEVPPSVRRLLRRCLEKDPRKRLSSIGDARLELDEIEQVATAAAPTVVGPRRTFLSMLMPAAAGAIVTAAIAAVVWTTTRQAPSPVVTRLSVIPDAGAEMYPDSAEVAISPDGRSVVFVVGDPQKTESQLWIRSLDSVVTRRVEGGDGAHLPFWSPDGSRIGFSADLKLKTVPVQGGRAAIVCNSPGFRGAAWNKNDVIIFAADSSGTLWQVSANGGEPKALTKLDESRKETSHRFPVFLPDDDHFLYAALPGRAGLADIVAGSLRDGTQTLVGSMESAPVYAEPGWLLFARRGVLAVQRFDPGTLKLSGEPIPLEDEPSSVLDAETSWTAGFAASASSTGALAYFSMQSVNTNAVWIDALGRPDGTVTLPSGRYRDIRVSPDGTRAALVRSTSRTESDLWLADLQRGGATPLSTGPGLNGSPVWSPDSTRVLMASDRTGPSDVFIKTAGDAAPEQLFYQSGVPFKNADSWSPDGKWITMRQLDQDTAQNLYLLPATGEIKPQPYVTGPGRDGAFSVSPSGRWIAYWAEDTGSPELYVQTFPKPGGRVRISNDGALWAWWADNGRRLLWVSLNRTRLMAVDVTEGGALKAGTPRLVATLPAGIVWIDAMPDRKRFLALMPERLGTGTVTVVQNWMTALKK